MTTEPNDTAWSVVAVTGATGKQGGATARRLLAGKMSGDQGPLVDKMFELVLNMPATEEDREEVYSFVRGMKQRLAAQGDKDPSLHAWSIACHALFASSRFQILE